MSHTQYTGFVEMTDRHGKRTRRVFDLDYAVENAEAVDIGEEYAAAVTAVTAIAAALEDLTLCAITRTGITTTVAASDGLGDTGSSVAQEALLRYAINEDGHPIKTWMFGVPAPLPLMFTGDNELIRVSPSQAEVVVLSAAIADNAYVSDGENINDTEGTNGLLSGVRRGKQVKYNPS